MEGMVAGDEHALKQLMQRHTPRLYFVVRRILESEGTDEDIEEVLGDSFLRAWETAHIYDSRRATVYTWLRTIVIYAALSKRRQNIRRHRHASAFIYDDQTQQRVYEMSEAKADEATAFWLAEAVDKLRKQWPDDAALIVRRYFNDESPSQIAQSLGVSANVIRVRLSRALARLRKSISGEISSIS